MTASNRSVTVISGSACIIPQPLPENATPGEKDMHLEKTYEFFQCLIMSLNNHAMHVATELQRHEQNFRKGDVELSMKAREIVNETSALLDANMGKFRSAIRANMSAFENGCS